MRKRICDIAIEVLRETDNPAVMWGDEGLLSMIAVRAGVSHVPGRLPTARTDKVLNALARTPGDLVPALTKCCSNRDVRIFYLPEHAPDWAKTPCGAAAER
ncbi:hypothetical protein HED60_15070 [Planctomycetales bacterium ZRK34]|nr:hypothetical protein HED60_15070 [Planctomycetales bacterium ZRK34]